MADGGATVPLTDLQQEVLALLARSRGSDRYLAGGTALNLAPTSRRFSEDIDFFHDSIEAVAESFARDSNALEAAGYTRNLMLVAVAIVLASPQSIAAQPPPGLGDCMQGAFCPFLGGGDMCVGDYYVANDCSQGERPTIPMVLARVLSN